MSISLIGGVLNTIGMWGTCLACESSVAKDLALGVFFAIEETIIDSQYEHKTTNFIVVAMGTMAITGSLLLSSEKIRSCSIICLQKLKSIETKTREIIKKIETTSERNQYFLEARPINRKFRQSKLKEPCESKREMEFKEAIESKEMAEFKEAPTFKEVKFHIDVKNTLSEFLGGIRDIVAGALVLTIPYVITAKAINGSVSLLSLVGVELTEEITAQQPSSMAIGIGCLLGSVLAGKMNRGELNSREILRSSAQFVGHTSMGILKLSIKGAGHGYNGAHRLFNAVKRTFVNANNYFPYRF